MKKTPSQNKINTFLKYYKSERYNEAEKIAYIFTKDFPNYSFGWKALAVVLKKTGKIFSIDFSERFEVPSVQVASDLIENGEIGKVVQTIGLGPHRLNIDTRPKWFFDSELNGGILCDIASHQIDQFLFFTKSKSAEIISSSIGNFSNPHKTKMEDKIPNYEH